LIADERRRKRDELLAATEADLHKVHASMTRPKTPRMGPPRGGRAVGAVVNKRKMPTHVELTITDEAFSISRKTDAIMDEARCDGIYLLHTSR
jgi:hypothetical protein